MAFIPRLGYKCNIAVVCGWSEVAPEEIEANKLLLAAAPELLEACQHGLKVAIAHAIDCNPHFDIKPGEDANFDAAVLMVDLFRAAIAKAKGTI